MQNDLAEKIEALKPTRNAVILAHNYQLPEVQDIADFRGDSLGLSRKAAETEADVIVFCGVRFMAETASILSPDKHVLLPAENAGCPMVDMLPLERLRELKRENPEAVVVTYVNSSAEMKAESDYCCTSSNAVQVVENIPRDRPVIFVPDQHLGSYVQEQTGRDLILHQGYCPTHSRILVEDIERKRQEHPNAEVMVHPECRADVRHVADYVESTGGMCRRARETDADEIIVGTEIGLIYRLREENPEKSFYAVSEAAVCPNMKQINLQTVLWSLEQDKYVVDVPEDIREQASQAVQRMVSITNS